MDSNVDGIHFEKLSALVENILTNGGIQLEDCKLKEIKKICRISDTYVTKTYSLLMHYLSAKHSEIRLSALHLCQELFKRSHCFRDLLVADFQSFVELVLDVNPTKPLPPPTSIARTLHKTSLKTIKEWNENYGSVYKKLAIGCRYLQQFKKVNFDSFDGMSILQQQENLIKESKLRKIKDLKLKMLRDEIVGNSPEIENCVTEMRAAFELLVSHPNNFLSDSNSDNIEVKLDDLRQHGFVQKRQNLSLELHLSMPQWSQDSEPIVNSLKDQYKLVNNRLLPCVLKWNITAIKLGAEESLQKKILDFKLILESIVAQYNELNLPRSDKHITSESSCDSDSDLEIVGEKEDYEENSVAPYLTDGDMVTHKEPQNSLTSDDQPGPSGLNRTASKIESSTPTRPFSDIELYQMKSQHLPPSIVRSNQVESFWSASNRDEMDTAAVAVLSAHYVEFPDQFEPVKWMCRTPLPSGKLCPRQDRFKCPLHGPIIARDEQGNPKDPSTVRKPKNTIPEWQDPSLLADIKAATGVDLTLPQKGKKGKKLKYPNLTDVSAEKNTPRKRLEKKVFNKSVVKKIAKKLDNLDGKQHREKFGAQWNYIYDTA